MKGLAVCYHLQLINLESNIYIYLSYISQIEDSKELMSLLNGDHLWNNFIKKQKQSESKDYKANRKSGKK